MEKTNNLLNNKYDLLINRILLNHKKPKSRKIIWTKINPAHIVDKNIFVIATKQYGKKAKRVYQDVYSLKTGKYIGGMSGI